MAEHSTELQKEFELERLILFSDAVFAIAITLIIIEIKFPEVEKGATPSAIFEAFRPTIIQFLAFCISFFFIGISWMRHLEICRYLRGYNKGLLRCNLFFLFFIVCFPFSASGITEHIRPSFMLPFIIYMVNITGVMFTQYLLCRYAFVTKPNLSVAAFDVEKKYILLNSKWMSVIFAITMVLYIVALLLSSPGSFVPIIPIYLLCILVLIMRRRLKKYKPASAEEWQKETLLNK